MWQVMDLQIDPVAAFDAAADVAADDDDDEDEQQQQQQQQQQQDGDDDDDDDDEDDDDDDDSSSSDLPPSSPDTEADKEEREEEAAAAAGCAAAAVAGPFRTGAWSPGETQALQVFVAGWPRRPTPAEVSPLAKQLRRTKAAVIDKLRGRRRRSSVARGRGRGRRAAGGGHGAELAGTTGKLWEAVAFMQHFVACRTAAESARLQTANMAALLGPADRAAFARQPLAHLVLE